MILQTDSELLKQLKSGNSKAYDQIFLKYYKVLCVNAYFFLKDYQASKDLVQIFFLEIWEKKLYLNLEGEIKGYLYRSVQNRCLNSLRKEESEQRKRIGFYEIYSNEDHTLDNNITESLYNRLANALQQLPKQRQVALQMVYFEKKKYQEAANVMGISINSLKTHLKIGIKNLREQVGSFENA
ncbi:RNA polymerase sigma factor [Pedobacter arcticus]|uniref:RNA polymerase sigma factor n=1 Tax=Pedobacter arcticus TaxID=752140 RepID=UPI0002E79A00|nr:sigma-70 family RNA polymerase sigma factor [Pedobacter arcticus]